MNFGKSTIVPDLNFINHENMHEESCRVGLDMNFTSHDLMQNLRVVIQV